MDQRKKTLILTGVVAVILSLGLLAGFSPSVSLRDRILDVVQLPKKAFSYILGEHPTSPHEENGEKTPLTEDGTQPPAAPNAAPQTSPVTEEVQTTPIDFFDEDAPVDLTRPDPPAEPTEEPTEPEEEPTEEPSAPDPEKELPVNQLPDHILE